MVPDALKAVKEGLAKNILEESEGAVVFKGEKYGLHTRVFVNSKGVPTYEAKELGLGVKKIEKYILRSAFDTSFDTSFGERYLPDDILWRQKEQFSDGVGYAWIDGLKEYTNIQVTDSDLENASLFFPHNTPMTKEAYFYRYIFEELFIEGSNTVPGGPSIACSTAKAVEWDLGFKGNLDPSGRSVLGVHTESVS